MGGKGKQEPNQAPPLFPAEEAVEAEEPRVPLAERMRPRTLDEFRGQAHIVGEGKPLRRMIESRRIPSLILWGPPGTGKSTLAHVIARTLDTHFVSYSAVLTGIKEVRDVMSDAAYFFERTGRQTLIFIDEIHRFNKSQQDARLPFVEDGTVTLFGTTTENPSFEIRNALLSRCRVLVLSPLQPSHIERIVLRALVDAERGLGQPESFLSPEGLRHIVAAADGDARVALNALEAAVSIALHRKLPAVDAETAQEALKKKGLLYDKDGEEHYNLISALHKSLRGSDPDGALYWLGRMLEAGEDPLYIARRMVRFASEDVGNADPHALTVAVAAMQAFSFIGLPEGELALAQTAVYLATAPKSNALYTGYGRVKEAIRRTGSLPVPLHIRNAPTKLMKELGYGKDYRYAHDYEDAYTPQDYLPEGLRGETFYRPTGRGYEKLIKERLEYWRKIREAKMPEDKKKGGGS